MPSFIINLVIAGLFVAGQHSDRLARIAIAGDPPTIYRLVDSEQGRSAIMAYGQDHSGEAIARWELNGSARTLEVTPDAGRACVLAARQPGGRRRSEESSQQWTLTVVDLITGRATDPMALGIVPSAVTLLAPPGSEPKLLIATTGRIAAYSLDPPRTSWFYTSPGENSAIAAGGPGLVAILRTGALAIIDPARRPRIDGRLQLTDDDVTSSIKLASDGLALAMSNDGAVAAVLHEDRLTISLIDVAAAKVTGTRRLSERLDSPVMRIIPAPGAGYRLVVASVAPLPSMVVIDIDAPTPVVAPPPRVPVAAPEPPPPAPPAAQTPPVPIAEPVVPPALKVEPIVPPMKEPVPQPEEAAAPKPQPETNATPAKEEPAPEQSRPTDEATLSGTITGETAAAKEVRFYGPNNILKLHAHAPVAGDGTFHIPLPPAGSYRVIITGAPGAHLFTHPEYRMVVVGTDGKGVAGIDFEVRGRL